jgi:hypothetical protein
MSFATAIQHPEAQIGVRALIRLRKYMVGFAPDGTYTNLGKIPMAVRPASLEVEGPTVNISSDTSGTSVPSRASAALCDAEANTYFYDAAAGYLYVNVGGAFATLATHYVWVSLNLNISTRAETADGFDYESRIISAPSISMRIERRFGASVQIGGGQLRIATADGAWDDYESWNWEASRVTLTAVVTTAGETASQAVASFGVESHTFADTELALTLKDAKAKADGKIPSAVFDRATYPNIDQSLIGKPIPTAYGRCFSIEPICIDKTAKTFLVASHAIASLDGVRVQADAGWRWITPTAIDLAASTFTLGADWTGVETVCCDVVGKKNADTTPMLNPVDILKDVLTSGGVTSFSSSFTTAKAAMEPLADEDDRKVPLRQVGIYIRESRDMFEIIKDLCEWCGLYLFTNSSGQFVVGAWQPALTEGSVQFDETNILSWSANTQTVSAGTTQRVRYEVRPQEGFDQSAVETRDANRFTAGVFSEPSDDLTTGLALLGDARALGQSSLFMAGAGETYWTITVPWIGWSTLPGGVCRVAYSTRHGLDTAAEVLEVAYDFGRGTAKLVLGNQRNFAGRAGFWVTDAGALPTRFASLTGYGTGSLVWNASWDPQIKRWARENVGYWTDENGFASSTDPDSFIPSSWSP